MKELVVPELKLKNRSIQFSSFQELSARAERTVFYETTVFSWNNMTLEPKVTLGGNCAKSLIFQTRKVGCTFPNLLS